MNELAQEAVARGARALDGPYPEWRQYVNFETLDMTSIEGCLLAQVVRGADVDNWRRSSSWGAGMRRLFGATDSAYGITHGFDATGGCGFDTDDLYEAWRALLSPAAPLA